MYIYTILCSLYVYIYIYSVLFFGGYIFGEGLRRLGSPTNTKLKRVCPLNA